MKLNLATIFTDHMVLQRGEPMKFFGTVEETGTLALSVNGERFSAEVGEGAFCVTFPALPDTREPLTLTFSLNGVEERVLSDVVLGEVWIAGGQSNMEMPLFTTYNGFEDAKTLPNEDIRFFTVPRRTFPGAVVHNWHFENVVSEDTPWQVSDEENSLHFSAIGVHFARKLKDALQVPVGIISCNWGGTCIETWMNFDTVEMMDQVGSDEYPENPPGASAKAEYYKKVMETLDFEVYAEKYNRWQAAYVEAAKDSDAVGDARVQGADEFARRGHMGNVSVWPDYGPWDSNRPGCLFENMLARIAPFPIKGVLWYQGESNGSRQDSVHYARLFNAMRLDWDILWERRETAIPFLVVEIAPFRNVRWNGTDGDDWGYLREQQRKAWCTAMVQIGDAGDQWNIHPCNKSVVGERLAKAAENRVYGRKVNYSGPVFKEAKPENGGMTVSFRYSGKGLAVRGGDELLDFTLCGADGVFQPAKAEITGVDTVFVHSDEVPFPLYVRAGFRDYPLLNLVNSDGLPASPFRTDTFE